MENGDEDDPPQGPNPDLYFVYTVKMSKISFYSVYEMKSLPGWSEKKINTLCIQILCKHYSLQKELCATITAQSSIAGSAPRREFSSPVKWILAFNTVKSMPHFQATAFLVLTHLFQGVSDSFFFRRLFPTPPRSSSFLLILSTTEWNWLFLKKFLQPINFLF